MSDPEATLGEWWCCALNHCFNAEGRAEQKPGSGWCPPSIYFQGMKFVLLGDSTRRPLANAAAERGDQDAEHK